MTAHFWILTAQFGYNCTLF